jgi:DNA-binding transcriptional ArsR family regulator
VPEWVMVASDMAKEQAGLVDARLAKALSHPMRAHILAILNDRVASPNEIAGMINERLPNVSYHVRALHELECIELVRTAQRRGAIEHYYRALKRPFFSDRDWKRLPQSARQAMSDVALQLIWDDVSTAIEENTFERRPDRYLTRSPLVLDERGWGELNEVLGGVLAEAERIGSQSVKRLAKADEIGIPTRLVMMHFEASEAEESEPSGGSRKRRKR